MNKKCNKSVDGIHIWRRVEYLEGNILEKIFGGYVKELQRCLACKKLRQHEINYL